MGRKGVEKVVEIKLSEGEKNALALSATKVKQGIEELDRLLSVLA